MIAVDMLVTDFGAPRGTAVCRNYELGSGFASVRHRSMDILGREAMFH